MHHPPNRRAKRPRCRQVRLTTPHAPIHRAKETQCGQWRVFGAPSATHACLAQAQPHARGILSAVRYAPLPFQRVAFLVPSLIANVTQHIVRNEPACKSMPKGGTHRRIAFHVHVVVLLGCSAAFSVENSARAFNAKSLRFPAKPVTQTLKVSILAAYVRSHRLDRVRGVAGCVRQCRSDAHTNGTDDCFLGFANRRCRRRSGNDGAESFSHCRGRRHSPPD